MFIFSHKLVSYFLIGSNQIYLFLTLIKHGIRVTKVYSIPMMLMTNVLLTFATRYDLGRNGTIGVLGFLSVIGVLV